MADPVWLGKVIHTEFLEPVHLLCSAMLSNFHTLLLNTVQLLGREIICVNEMPLSHQLPY